VSTTQKTPTSIRLLESAVHDGRTAEKEQWVKKEQEVEEEEDKDEEQNEKVGIRMPKCCLQVTVHPKYSVNDHSDECFPWLSTVLLGWNPNSSLQETQCFCI
jgi:hypothetical protein